MPQRALLRTAPQDVFNSVVAALLCAVLVLSPGVATPPSQVHIAVDDAGTAGQFGSRLPLALTFHDRMGTAVFARLSEPLAVDQRTPAGEYRAGDVAYVASEQSIVVFLSDGSAVPAQGLVLVGHTTNGLDDLAGCVRDCPIDLLAATD
ncbi:cyclophilin-like fold protein [Microbacterium yannicii]|nr:cyclophilin-like fold protein [Microbacterium yannicii]MCO5954463.1 cyclophilin-like fold protein [Microbacterium yannicii]